MNQASIQKLIPALRFSIPIKKRRLSTPEGPQGRIKQLRQTITALYKYERIELGFNKADETRQYAERLIHEAILHGDCHVPTMEMADYWLLEKQLIHKLFKVFVPRYKDYNTSFTRLLKAPTFVPSEAEKEAMKFKFEKGYDYPVDLDRSVLELKGNPFPPLKESTVHAHSLLHNILLGEVRREYKLRKESENKVSHPEE